MFSGFIPPPSLAANVPTAIYNGPPVGQVGIVCVTACNRGGGGLGQLALAVSRSVANAIPNGDWIAYDRTLPEFAEYEKELILVFPGEKVFARASLPCITVRADGYERLGAGAASSAAPGENAVIALYTAPANKSATGGILICNRGNQVVRPQIAITSAALGAIPDSAWITYSRAMGANAEFEKNRRTVMAGETVYYRCDSADTSVRGQFSIGDV